MLLVCLSLQNCRTLASLFLCLLCLGFKKQLNLSSAAQTLRMEIQRVSPNKIYPPGKPRSLADRKTDTRTNYNLFTHKLFLTHTLQSQIHIYSCIHIGLYSQKPQKPTGILCLLSAACVKMQRYLLQNRACMKNVRKLCQLLETISFTLVVSCKLVFSVCRISVCAYLSPHRGTSQNISPT